MTDLKVYPTGRVYQIVNDVDDLKYVGSTIQTLAERMAEHRRKSKTGTEAIYQHIRAIGVDHFKILLLEQTGPTTREALRALEHKWMVAMATVNIGLNGRYESQFCEHQRVRSVCKDCGGARICEHQRQRNACKECNPCELCGSTNTTKHRRSKKHLAAVAAAAALSQQPTVEAVAASTEQPTADTNVAVEASQHEP